MSIYKTFNMVNLMGWAIVLPLCSDGRFRVNQGVHGHTFLPVYAHVVLHVP